MRIRGLCVLLAAAGLACAQTPVIDNGGIGNAASFKQPIAPGSLISIFGTQLASSVASADSIPLSKSLGGVTVQFVQGGNTYNAPMLYVQRDDPANNVESQINAQAPWELSPNGGDVSVVVTNGSSSAPMSVPVVSAAPGVFSSNGFGIAVNNADGTLAWPAGAVPGLTTHAAKAGDILIIYATGMGSSDTQIADGDIPPAGKITNTLANPTVLVGGTAAQLIYSVMSPQFVGVNQIAIYVPKVASGDKVPLQIQAGGVTSPDSVTIAVTQ